QRGFAPQVGRTRSRARVCRPAFRSRGRCRHAGRPAWPLRVSGSHGRGPMIAEIVCTRLSRIRNAAATAEPVRRLSIMTKHSLLANSLALVAVSFAGGRDAGARDSSSDCADPAQDQRSEGQRLFEDEAFGGNGRTCLTCHSRETGTLSAKDVARRFRADPDDPLFSFDGSDDGEGHGVSRILGDATILIEIPLPANVTLADDPSARS